MDLYKSKHGFKFFHLSSKFIRVKILNFNKKFNLSVCSILSSFKYDKSQKQNISITKIVPFLNKLKDKGKKESVNKKPDFKVFCR